MMILEFNSQIALQAEKAFKRALAISKKRFGFNNMITIQCILKYGLMLLDVGKCKRTLVFGADLFGRTRRRGRKDFQRYYCTHGERD